MFEHYTEKARRVIFFARYEASQFGADCIETEHLLLGLLREDKVLTHRFLPSINSVKFIHQRVRDLTPMREKISTAVDLPLTLECKRALAYAAEEGDKLNHRDIGTQHLLLGLLREENCLAATLLRECGLSTERVREELAAHGTDSSESSGKLLQTNVLVYLESLSSELSILAAESRIYVRPDRSPSTPPFLCIEVLSANERIRDLRQRIDEHLAMGLRYLWLFDPGTRYVYVATPEAGLQEFKGDVLRTDNPVLELPLAEVFA
jgi:hypothetical protein